MDLPEDFEPCGLKHLSHYTGISDDQLPKYFGKLEQLQMYVKYRLPYECCGKVVSRKRWEQLDLPL
jgi:hypothetical protein